MTNGSAMTTASNTTNNVPTNVSPLPSPDGPFVCPSSPSSPMSNIPQTEDGVFSPVFKPTFLPSPTHQRNPSSPRTPDFKRQVHALMNGLDLISTSFPQIYSFNLNMTLLLQIHEIMEYRLLSYFSGTEISSVLLIIRIHLCSFPSDGLTWKIVQKDWSPQVNKRNVIL